MYSWEINNYIKKRNSYLNPDEVLEVTNIRENPQINHITYSPFNNLYEMWDIDGNYFKFTPMYFKDYIFSILGENYMKDDSYRLYINYGAGYDMYMTSNGMSRFKTIVPLFTPLDKLILNENHDNYSYLIIKNENDGDTPYWISHGDKNDYNDLKSNHTIHNSTGRKLN